MICVVVVNWGERVMGMQSYRSVWSNGMIPPLGGGGPGFDSRNGPKGYISATLLVYLTILIIRQDGTETLSSTILWEWIYKTKIHLV